MGAGIVRIVSDASFERAVLAADRPVLVAFGTPTCGPCRLLSPALRALAATHRDVLVVAKLDIDANPATAKRYEIETYPTCILFRAGAPIAWLDGYMPLRKIEAELAPHLDAAAGEAA